MSKYYQEEPSLLEVRKWKEQCQLERSQLTDEEYLKKLKEEAENFKAKYNIHLQRVTLSPVSS
jgi:hypothetical protein